MVDGGLFGRETVAVCFADGLRADSLALFEVFVERREVVVQRVVVVSLEDVLGERRAPRRRAYRS